MILGLPEGGPVFFAFPQKILAIHRILRYNTLKKTTEYFVFRVGRNSPTGGIVRDRLIFSR